MCVGRRASLRTILQAAFALSCCCLLYSCYILSLHWHHDDSLDPQPPKHTAAAVQQASIMDPREYHEEIEIARELRNELWPTRRPPKKLPTLPPPGEQRRLYLDPVGQLGSQLFEYASVYGLAMLTGRELWTSHRLVLPYIFRNLTTQRGYDPKARLYVESGAGKYSPKILPVSANNSDVTLCCYLQSWRYFRTVNIRSQFHFKDDILATARLSIQKHFTRLLNRLHSHQRNPMLDDTNQTIKSLEDYKITGATEEQPSVTINGTAYSATYIGLHVHRLGHSKLKIGFRFAPVDYIHAAMKYFRRRHSNAVFFLVTDDVAWCRANVSKTAGDVAITGYNTAPVDLAILSLMQHSIMTTGAFGWWGSWLAGGDVLYYADWLERGSEAEKIFHMKDYFPPWWMKFSQASIL